MTYILQSNVSYLKSSACCRFLAPHRWQETDYRDFRVNFIQYMRSPPTLADDSEMVSVDFVDESSGSSMLEEKKGSDDEDDLQPAVIGTVEYANAPPDPREEVKEPCLRAWPIERREDGVNNDGAGAGWTDEVTSQARLSADAAAVDNDALDATSPISEAQAPAVPEAEARADMDGTSSIMPPLCDPDKSTVIVEDDHEDDATDEDTCWDDQQERTARSGPCLSSDSTECDDDRDRDIVRVGRSLTDLDTVQRSTGAKLHEGICGNFAAAAAAAATLGANGCDQGRPRALSLDGWFTCGLQYGNKVRSSETHDHVDRLRDLVKLVSMFPGTITCIA